MYQLREEEREAREHQEALRREELAQALAEAEAAAVEELMVPEEEGMGMEEVRDLDDDIPEADGMGGLDDGEDDIDDIDDDEDDEDEDEEEESEVNIRRVVAQRLADPFGINGFDGDESELGEEEQEQMLHEEDLAHEQHGNFGDGDTDMGGMDMDADLDNEVPEAGLGGYEHTDTEEECTSSEDESVDMGRLPPQTNFVSSMVRSDGTQRSSMELRSGSSLQGSSPRQRMQRPRAPRGSRRG